MLGQRRGRCPNIKTIFGQFCFDGCIYSIPHITDVHPQMIQSWPNISDTRHWTIPGLLSGVLVQWSKLPAWKIGDHWFQTRTDIQVSKKQNVSSSLTPKDSIVWGASWPRGSVIGLWTPELEFQILCLEGSVISFIILRMFSWPSLAYMGTKVS